MPPNDDLALDCSPCNAASLHATDVALTPAQAPESGVRLAPRERTPRERYLAGEAETLCSVLDRRGRVVASGLPIVSPHRHLDASLIMRELGPGASIIRESDGFTLATCVRPSSRLPLPSPGVPAALIVSLEWGGA